VLWVSLIAESFDPDGADEAAYAKLATELAAARSEVRQIRCGDDLATRMGVRAGAA
jgi:hypothetical protein